MSAGVLLSALLMIALLTTVVGCADVAATWHQTDAVDDVGRPLATAEQVGATRPDKIVAMFYWSWHVSKSEANAWCPPGPFDISRILAEHPEAMHDFNHSAWGPERVYHHWGRPLLDYYSGTDQWVIRRHMQMLAHAGVDVIFLDATNHRNKEDRSRQTLEAGTYRPAMVAVMEVVTQLIREGQPTPRIAFYTIEGWGHWSEVMTEGIHSLYYCEDAPYRYPESWFTHEGKPLIVGDIDRAAPHVRNFFTMRWDGHKGPKPAGWPWISYPWPQFVTRNRHGIEAVPVSVAQNYNHDAGHSDAFSRAWYGHTMRGRNFSGDNSLTCEDWPGAINHGINFGIQWDFALASDPDVIFVTGWNEWTARKLSSFRGDAPPEQVLFVDQATQEYSRDIEPMAGGHGDNYYLQLIDHVRKFKGMPLFLHASSPKTIDIDGSFDQWDNVSPVFLDYAGDAAARSACGYGGEHYTTPAGRNDLQRMKVARDDANVYFLVRTEQDISPRIDPQWMRLLIDIDGNHTNGWHGFDFIINRLNPISPNQAILERSRGGWQWEKAATVLYRCQGPQMHIAVPRSALGDPADPLDLRFKWADSNLATGNIFDLYRSGDTAPDGRLAYVYRTGQPSDFAPPKRDTVMITGVSASVEEPCAPARSAIDGNSDTYWCTGDLGDVLGEQWLAADLGVAQEVAGVRLTPRVVGRAAVGFPRDFSVQALGIDGTWRDIPGQTFRQAVNPVAVCDLAFTMSVRTAGIRLRATKFRVDETGQRYCVQLADMKLLAAER